MPITDVLTALLASIGVAALVVTSGILILNGATHAFAVEAKEKEGALPDQIVSYYALTHNGERAKEARQRLTELAEFMVIAVGTILGLVGAVILISLAGSILSDWAADGWPGGDLARAILSYCHDVLHLEFWLADAVRIVVIVASFAVVFALSRMVHCIIQFRREIAPEL